MQNDLKETITSLAEDFFTDGGLTLRTGLSKLVWLDAILKEIIDNALDAIEGQKSKTIWIGYDHQSKVLEIMDNGTGLSIDQIQNGVYDFQNYYSSKRYFARPSRGRQGNGLKCVIGICHVLGYRLLWHTADQRRIENQLDLDDLVNGNIKVRAVDHGKTDERGIEIRGIEIKEGLLEYYVSQYAECNRDVSFFLTAGTKPVVLYAEMGAIDKTASSSINFYTLKTFQDFVQTQRAQNPEQTYKQMLLQCFGKIISDQSAIKSKLKDLDINSEAFSSDFYALQKRQNKKKYTLLKKNVIGFQHYQEMEDQEGIPYIVEVTAEKLSEKRTIPDCIVYTNNTITYINSAGVCFAMGSYQIGNRKARMADGLDMLLQEYTDYRVTIHFISPQFQFKDAGKVQIDITGIVDDFMALLKKALSKANSNYSKQCGKGNTKRQIMRDAMDEAYLLASTGGKYAVTSRQLYYKMRELSGIEESSSTYQEFSQIILTEWMDDHPDHASKIYYSDRGNFYIGKQAEGLGTKNVNALIAQDAAKQNGIYITCAHDAETMIQSDFAINRCYDKVLYIEKTGFDAIFQAEKIAEKYNLILVSGQGFSTRAAKTLLHYLQTNGLTIFCMHDFDIAGVQILDSLQTPNEKFAEKINVIDLGITLEDVKKYRIKPERIKKQKNGKEQTKAIPDGLPPELVEFFDAGQYVRRVELNAFSTEQILEILDSKLKTCNHLPRYQMQETLQIDQEALKREAWNRNMESVRQEAVNQLPDITPPAGNELLTAQEAMDRAPEIMEEMIREFQQQLINAC